MKICPNPVIELYTLYTFENFETIVPYKQALIVKLQTIVGLILCKIIKRCIRDLISIKGLIEL